MERHRSNEARTSSDAERWPISRGDETLAGDSLDGLAGGSSFSGLPDGMPPGDVSCEQRFSVAGIALATGSVFIEAERFLGAAIGCSSSGREHAALSLPVRP